MFMKTRIALAAALVAATSTVALAATFDQNPASRHPAYTQPMGEVQLGTLRSAPVAPQSGHIAAMIDAGFYGYARPLDPSGADLNDRGSSPYAAAVN